MPAMRAVAAFGSAALGCLLETMRTEGLLTMVAAAIGTAVFTWWLAPPPSPRRTPSTMLAGTAGVAAVLAAAGVAGSGVGGGTAAMLLMAGGMGAMVGEEFGEWVRTHFTPRKRALTRG